jgi:hypothetical protein
VILVPPVLKVILVSREIQVKWVHRDIQEQQARQEFLDSPQILAQQVPQV